MTPDELQAAAHRILETVAREHPAVASDIATVLLVEILAIGLHGAGDEVAVGSFVLAINDRLAEIAAQQGSVRRWKLIAVDWRRRSRSALGIDLLEAALQCHCQPVTLGRSRAAEN